MASHLEPRGGEPVMRVDGGEAEAQLGRGANRAGGVAAVLVDLKPLCACGLLVWALVVRGVRACETLVKEK